MLILLLWPQWPKRWPGAWEVGVRRRLISVNKCESGIFQFLHRERLLHPPTSLSGRGGLHWALRLCSHPPVVHLCQRVKENSGSCAFPVDTPCCPRQKHLSSHLSHHGAATAPDERSPLGWCPWSPWCVLQQSHPERGGLLVSAASLPELTPSWDEPSLTRPPHTFLFLPALKLSDWHFQHDSAKMNLNYTHICLLHTSVNLLSLLPWLLILLLWDCTRMVLSSRG